MLARRIRVLIVDDAVVVRRILTDVLSSDPDIHVVGVAANGRIALQKVEQIPLDVVTLDVEMPDLDGLATLRELRRLHPEIPVIMFSSLTERGAAATLEALALGAADYVTKPANVGSVQAALQQIRDELIPRIRALAGEQAPAPAMRARARTTPGTSLPPEVVTIGASTGGPGALAALLGELPADLPVPILIVQHMPPLFTRLLAERLDRECVLTVGEAEGEEVLVPGRAYLAPGDRIMTLERAADGLVRISLGPEVMQESVRAAIDPLFTSVASIYAGRSLGIVLTGMGHDGVKGAEAIVDAGGSVLAQDEASSVVWGMPGDVCRAGLADSVMSPAELATEICRRVHRHAAA